MLSVVGCACQIRLLIIEVVADKFIALDMLPSYATYTHSSFELIRPFVSSEGETILSRIFYI